MQVVVIAIDRIEIGKRRREDLGDIVALAKGIERVGLLHPIVVDRNGRDNVYRLIAGERRLRAAQQLGWTTIEATQREHLSESELREIELEENTNRKDFSAREAAKTFQTSKMLMQDAQRVVDRVSADSAKTKTGRKPIHAVARERIAEGLGIKETSLREAEQHVETAEQFPFMQAPDWRQYHVLEARAILANIPAEEHAEVTRLIELERYVHPREAIKLLGKLANDKKPPERAEIYRLARSPDKRDHSLAITKTMELPPMPNPVLLHLKQMIRVGQLIVKNYPNDPEAIAVKRMLMELRNLETKCRERSRNAGTNAFERGA